MLTPPPEPPVAMFPATVAPLELSDRICADTPPPVGARFPTTAVSAIEEWSSAFGRNAAAGRGRGRGDGRTAGDR